MKSYLALLLLFFAMTCNGTAAPQSGQGKTIDQINVIPKEVLKRSISPKFYKTLMISPIDGWVTVRGNVSGTTINGLKVIHSEPNHLNDHLALQRAKELQIAGNYSIENPRTGTPVLVHLLLYKIADGTAALSFANFDGAGGNQMQYWGSARLAVLKNDGKWVDIKGPASLEGKGVAVRQGIKNDLSTSLKMERLTTAAEATNFGGPGGR